MNRREFLRSTVVSGVGLAAIPCLGETAVGKSGAEKNHGQVVFQTSFAPGDPMPVCPDHVRVTSGARRGAACLLGEVTGKNQHKTIGIPYTSLPNMRLTLKTWIRGKGGPRCAVWLRSGNERKRIGTINKVPEAWREETFTFDTGALADGTVEIVVPSSWGANPGKAWVDEILLTAVPTPKPTPYPEGAAEDFPVIAADSKGTLWYASINRHDGSRAIDISRIDCGERFSVIRLAPSGITGIERPALTATANGCAVAFAVERNHVWRVRVVGINGATGKTAYECDLAAPGASVNMLPRICACGKQLTVVWEANAGPCRGIWSAVVSENGKGMPPERISGETITCSNADVAVRANGTLVAVWDGSDVMDISVYMAERKNGVWQPAKRLTSDTRIERHPRVACRRNDVWVAWQAQGFSKHTVNGVRDQHIALAKVTPSGLLMPPGFYKSVSGKADSLMRPVPHVDPDGRVWLTARRSMGLHCGWEPLAWCFSGKNITGPIPLWHDQGRWRPVTLAWDAAGRGYAAVQRDDLVKGWREQGIRPDWLYEARVVPAQADAAGAPPAEPALAPLEMPATDFTVRNRVVSSGALLPRQHQQVGNAKLTLFWGDFHEHTDISVCQRRTNPPNHDLYANQRDIEKLDFTAICDHGYNFDRPQWAYNGEQTRLHHDPGRFVTFLAEEWTADHVQYTPKRSYRKYGHRNHIFLDPYYDKFYDSRDGDIPPRQLWQQLGGVEFIAIPHQLADTGNCPTDWREVDEHLQPVAEIFQARESYEYLGCPRQAKRALETKGHFIQDAWEAGIVIGVIASPDHGGGRGKVGVWAGDLSRESLFAAVRARHTFGTSGAKISLLLTHAESMMGDVVRGKPATDASFKVRAVATQPIRELVIFRNNEPVFRTSPETCELDTQWLDPQAADHEKMWYYARVHCADGELAWSSPIWFFA